VPETTQEPAGSRFVAPIVVTQQKIETAELDERPDFEGRGLPPAYIPPVAGDDHVAAESVLAGPPEATPAEVVEAENLAPVSEETRQEQVDAGDARSDEPVETGQSGFGNLFGWRRNAENDEGPAEDATPEAIVSSPDDHPEPAPFDDADLEIPAFLRRSANH
jgi:cell division protein FtsZ